MTNGLGLVATIRHGTVYHRCQCLRGDAGVEGGMTAEERAMQVHDDCSHSHGICHNCAVAALRAHANAALEKASSHIKSHQVIEGERDDIRETIETVRDQFAAAVLALREEG